MSHFTVLTAVQLPDSLESSLRVRPDRQPDNKVLLALLKGRFGDQSVLHALNERPVDDQARFESLVEDLLEEQLAPYMEGTTDPRYLEFVDYTEDCRREYENEGETYVRMLDGRWLPTYSYVFSANYEVCDGKVYKRSFGQMHHRKRTKKAKRMFIRHIPHKQKYQTMEKYATEYAGYVQGDTPGTYGYFSNPNAQYDWYQIGGRWPNRFLVKEGCQTVIYGDMSYLLRDTPDSEAPDGYCWVAGARKMDIAWDVMKELYVQDEQARFHKLEKWYNGGEAPDEGHHLTLTERGIESWGTVVYAKGETLEEHLRRMGLSEEYNYPISTFAFLGEDGWFEMGNMGWFGISSNNKEEQTWNQMVEQFIEELPEDIALVSVDCHI